MQLFLLKEFTKYYYSHCLINLEKIKYTQVDAFFTLKYLQILNILLIFVPYFMKFLIITKRISQLVFEKIKHFVTALYIF